MTDPDAIAEITEADKAAKPAVPLPEATEAAANKPADPPTIPADPEAKATIAAEANAVSAQVHAVESGEGETEKLAEIQKYLEKRREGGMPMLAAVIDVLGEKEIPKAGKEQTARNLLELYLFNERFVDPHAYDRRHTGWGFKFLQGTYEFLQKYHEYFGDLVDQNWYKENLTKIAEACLQELEYHREKRRYPLWVAENYSGLLTLAETIHKISPVPNLDAKKPQAVAIIAELISEHVERDFFQGSGGEALEAKTIIKRLAEKHGITLPSEKDIWEKDITEELKSIEANLAAGEKRQEGKRETGDLEQDMKRIKTLSALCRAAEKKFPNFRWPKGKSGAAEIEKNLEERHRNIKRKNVDMEIARRVENITVLLERKEFRKMEWEIEDLIRFLGTAMGDEQIDLSAIIQTLTALKTAEETRIMNMVSEIQTDPGKAEERGEELAQRGAIFNGYVRAIEKLNGANTASG